MVSASYRWYKDLNESIIGQRCSLCGTCAASCVTNMIRMEDGSPPELRGECIGCGVCWAFCPRGGLSLADVEEKVFGARSSTALGNYREILSARTKSRRVLERAQDGGVVTTLLSALFKAGEIDAAIVAGFGAEPWRAKSFVVASAEEAVAHGGSIYSQSYPNAAVKEALAKGYKRIALVGVPCEIEGIRAIQQYQLKGLDTGAIRYLIGLFCMENFDYQNLYIQKLRDGLGLDLGAISRINVTKGAFSAYDKENRPLVQIPVRELRPFILKSCRYCGDLSNNLADISVGSIGSGKGFSTVIIRTSDGDAAWKLAAEDLEVTEVDDLDLLIKLADEKEDNAKKR